MPSLASCAPIHPTLRRRLCCCRYESTHKIALVQEGEADLEVQKLQQAELVALRNHNLAESEHAMHDEFHRRQGAELARRKSLHDFESAFEHAQFAAHHELAHQIEEHHTEVCIPRRPEAACRSRAPPDERLLAGGTLAGTLAVHIYKVGMQVNASRRKCSQ